MYSPTPKHGPPNPSRPTRRSRACRCSLIPGILHRQLITPPQHAVSVWPTSHWISCRAEGARRADVLSFREIYIDNSSHHPSMQCLSDLHLIGFPVGRCRAYRRPSSTCLYMYMHIPWHHFVTWILERCRRCKPDLLHCLPTRRGPTATSLPRGELKSLVNGGTYMFVPTLTSYV
jgi:hypothetical protein